MYFERINTPGLAQNAYIIAGGENSAAVVDPRRDIDVYLETARREGLTIRYVLVTHRQEDYILGASELAEVSGAELVTADAPTFKHTAMRVSDGEEIQLDDLRILCLETPGHTLDSISYVVYPESLGGRPWGVFTGDALFAGSTGRTDLVDPAKTTENAGRLHDAVNDKLLPLGDATLVFPAHGAGSVCGAGMAERDHTTLGLERSVNPVFTLRRQEFVEQKLATPIERPPYFEWVRQANSGGGAPLPDRRRVRMLQERDFSTASRKGIIIDTRQPEAFAAGHVPGAFSIWLDGITSWAGWIADKDSAIFLILEEPGHLDYALASLYRVGLDHVTGVLAGGFPAWRDAGLPVQRFGTITPREVRGRLKEGSLAVLDVRRRSEWDSGHIPEAKHVFAGDLPGRTRELDTEESLAVTCGVGVRASLGLSILSRDGLSDISNLLGGMTAWTALDFPTETGGGEERAA